MKVATGYASSVESSAPNQGVPQSGQLTPPRRFVTISACSLRLSVNSPPSKPSRPDLVSGSLTDCGSATGAVDGHWGQLLNQAAGVAVAWGLSIVGTLILLVLVDKTIGLRVSAEEESAGLDLSQHGEEGYDLNS